MRFVTWPLVVVGLLLGCGSARAATISPGCLPTPLPGAPAPTTAALDTANFGESMHVEIWRHACLDGTGTVLLMRASPSTAAPFLCSGDFSLVQGGLQHNTVLRLSAEGARLCADLLAPTTVVVDSATGPAIPFDPAQAFTLVFAGWDGAPKAFQFNLAPAGAVPVTLTAAVLPGSRSVTVGAAATAFASIVASGSADAVGCTITPLTPVPASFEFRMTDPQTNAVIGGPSAPATIPGGSFKTFLLAFTPGGTFSPTAIQFSFDCGNSPPAPILPGVNTLVLSADAVPVPDIVALAATVSNDGIVTVPGPTGMGAFAVSTVNVGAGGTITASADTGSAALPVSLAICRTDPSSGTCLSSIGSSVPVAVNPGDTATFSVFVTGYDSVAFDPAVNRVFVRFEDGGQVTRGTTSVAIRTQ